MPIIDVELVVPDGSRGDADRDPGLARRLADACGDVLGAASGRVWVRVRELARSSYDENGGAPRELAPVFVSVLLADEGEAGERRELAAALASAVAEACGRPVDNVHVLFEPPARGRIAFGGRLVE